MRPSPVFGLLVVVLGGSAAVLWRTATTSTTTVRLSVFVFVLTGWIVSLCVHEFAHATSAWVGGDRSVAAKGYLTLDPRRYVDGQMSIVLPILFVIVGGIGLPGGAVLIDRRKIPRRGMRSVVSASGPLTNLAFAAACGVVLWLGLVPDGAPLRAAVAFLAFLEVAATILNALPVPGLDGFGVLAPWLPDETVAALAPISQYAFFALFLALFFVRSANAAFFGLCYRLVARLGTGDPALGQRLFFFWRPLY